MRNVRFATPTAGMLRKASDCREVGRSDAIFDSDRLPGLPSPTAFTGVIQRTVRAAGADSIALERIEQPTFVTRV
jgi:hypothetical protein